MEFFESSFFKTSLEMNKKYKSLSIVTTTFPEFRIMESCDDFWKKLWTMIDEAKSYIWLVTYTWDNSISANYTAKKLIEARKRGTRVALFLDDLNNSINEDLLKELKQVGATVYSLNEIAPYWTGLKINKDMFSRHHEKAVISDDTAIVGSSNVADLYSGPLYGTNDFLDLNVYMKNICLKDLRHMFKGIADKYNIRLDAELSNEEIVKKLDEEFKDSIFNLDNVQLLRTIQPYKRDINDFLLRQIKAAKKSIYIVQPYYYPMKKVETAIAEALERGVHVEVLTAAKRDPPALKPVSNYLMMQKLINKGLKVYELSDKFLHMKVYQFDDEIYTMGSFNNDKLSWNVNHELNIVVSGEKECAKMTKIINHLRDMSVPVDPTIRIGLYRYLKIQFWGGFTRLGNWMSNKKNAIQAERQFKEFLASKELSRAERNEELTRTHENDNKQKEL